MTTKMKNIIKSTLLLLCAIGLFTACDDDLDHNPTLVKPTQFVLNTPAISTTGVVDLANSDSVNLTCSQPDYGFPASTKYTVQIATKADMSDAADLSQSFTSTHLNLDAAEVAATLTNLELAAGHTEAEFPLTVPVYFRAKAVMTKADGTEIDTTAITSNVVSLQKVFLRFSLPAVTCPENLYITGGFNGWSWDTALQMVEVYGSRDNANSTAVFWHMVYIDGSGIKFNTAKAWDGNERGYAGITVDPASEKLSEIEASSDGNIASNKPGWYLMVVRTQVNGRNIDYTVTFNEPNVWLMGPVVGNSDWKELEPGMSFTVPSTADGQFVSPKFKAAVPGGDGDGIRFYVKIPGYDWWKAEMIVGGDFGETITYRGNGGDQARVAGNVGQRVYLNFTSETGEVK